MKELLKELVREYRTNLEFKICIAIGLFILLLILSLEYFVVII